MDLATRYGSVSIRYVKHSEGELTESKFHDISWWIIMADNELTYNEISKELHLRAMSNLFGS